MGVERHAVGSVVAAWQDEIEHAIDNIKRTKFDRWMRREWHKAAVRGRGSPERKAEWKEWRRRRSGEAGRDGTHGLNHSRASQPKVWVRGRVPKEFLDWVEGHWSHDGETRAVLNECCFEVWEG